MCQVVCVEYLHTDSEERNPPTQTQTSVDVVVGGDKSPQKMLSSDVTVALDRHKYTTASSSLVVGQTGVTRDEPISDSLHVQSVTSTRRTTTTGVSGATTQGC